MNFVHPCWLTDKGGQASTILKLPEIVALIGQKPPKHSLRGHIRYISDQKVSGRTEGQILAKGMGDIGHVML
jgi:hypothetical protein